MGKIIYITGGARSGKSSFAEKLIQERYKSKIYLATAIPFDDEMKDRIEKHKKQRGKNWKTIENYKNLSGILKNHIEEYDVILLDCITNMVTNLMIIENEYDWDNISMKEVDSVREKVIREIESVIEFIKKNDIDMVAVSNEVGLGLVPTTALGRHFRDIGGKINQIMAEASDEAYLVVSGLNMRLK
ncbi:bifunctional adenosylcobinamide kinase/adenosylcobinamide-phosphate guanylyltransferase [Fusobacterium perfoetens]|uniref:bifunctional adenosylcobinamide kinase/adenosylcobinamide-phosphate guanylyltransferase n=1 Tax=Fusobacterium perfoetens TaxID=852 RepID=UPI001F20B12E|nr:bifunctional adenosylcobinamide kinase/adenosylcobinamide-phosphate guanylyltransferase [Fusobacterium perfoetens]MCF2624851.1 bifunctional adenosylcobinamide kinase/adenosylcobinamide-phosphate guanylyltransferase [Fusobacterium perfoetens]